MKKLQVQSLEDLKQLTSKNNISNLSLTQLTLLIEAFSLHKEFDQAQTILDYFNKNLTWGNKLNLTPDNNEEFFETQLLKSLTTYFSENKEKKVIKKNVKILQSLISLCEENFCEEYLLIAKNQQNTQYYAKENFLFLSFCDELSDILNEFEFTKIADKIFLIKGKLELGLQRYFIQKKEIVSNFNTQNFKYQLADNREKLNLVHLYNYDNDILKEYIKLALKEYNKAENIEYKLEIILFLNSFKQEKEKLDLKLLENILKDFPKYLVNKKDFSINIEKSLFPQHEIKHHNLTKEKLVTFNLDNINTKILFLLAFR